MQELYRMIEERIQASGYPEPISGREFYQDISEEADEKENGVYLFGIHKGEDLIYRGSMTIMDDQFDLHYVDIIQGDKTWHVDFDV